MKLSDKAYAIGKYIAGVALPAMAAFYASLSGLWSFPNATAVVGTIASVDTLLGALLLISTAQYNRTSAVPQADDTPVE